MYLAINKLVAIFLVCHVGTDPSTQCVEGAIGPDNEPYVIERQVKVVSPLECLSPLAIETAESDPRFGDSDTFTKIICKRLVVPK